MPHSDKLSMLSVEGKSLRMTWTWFRDAYTARAGGGIWYEREGRWQKVAEHAEASCFLISDSGEEQSSSPIQGSFRKLGEVQEVNLTHPPLTVAGVTWTIEERWRIGTGDNRLHWQFVYTPSGPVDDRCLLSTSFSVFPSVWRVHTLPSYCGFYDGIAFAIFPRPEDCWWMRIEGPRLVRHSYQQTIWDMGIQNVHYPFTYSPTKVVQAGHRQPVVLEGFFLVDQWGPERLVSEVRAPFTPEPASPPARPLPDVEDLAFEALERAFADAKESGFFAEDEGAFTDMVQSDGWKHQHDDAVFGAGFSCGYSGHALIPLLRYHQRTGNPKAKEMARQIANWLVRYAQTPYGAYHNLIDMSGPWGFDFIAEDFVYPHTTAKIAINLAAAYQAFDTEAYKSSTVRACDWLLGLQREDGSLPWKVVGTTGGSDGTEAYAAATAEVLAAWVAAWQLADDDRYLNAAQRLADWVIASFVEPCFFGGYITDDRPANGLGRWETPSSPAHSCVINGLASLYKATGIKRYLEAARQAGHAHLLWQWPWEPPEGCLQRRLRGTTQAAGGWNYTIEQTLGNELPDVIEGFLNLYDCTQEALWREAAEMALFCLPEQQFTDPNDLKYGTLWEGWNVNYDHEAPLKDADWSRGLIGGTSALINVLEMYWQLKQKYAA